jgi:hypothetical protein
MTAEEWDARDDFAALRGCLFGARGTRKWYCFGLACMRLIEDHLTEHTREALQVCERYVERRATNGERARARREVLWGGRPRGDAEYAAYWATAAPTDITPAASASVPNLVRRVIARARGEEAGKSAQREFTRLLREIFPNPFRDVRIEKAWLRWSDGAARRVAETINDEGDFARAPVLADALEEAGCADERILAHLRGPSPHARGCWVIDAVLGKK